MVGLTLMFVLSAPACSLGGAAVQPSPVVPSPETPAAPAATGWSSAAPPTPGSPSDATASSPVGDQLGQPVATRTSAKGGARITLTLYPVQRDGATSHLNLTLSSPASAAERVQVSDTLADGNYSAGDKDGLTADGLQLVDGKNAKLYLVASDGQGQCLCSRNLQTMFLQEGIPVLISATFAAPPADVTAVDVRIPAFGTVRNVPVD